MRRPGTIALVALLCGGMLIVGLPLVLFMVLMGTSSESIQACRPDGTVTLTSRSMEAPLSEEQLANASTIISEGNRLGMPERAVVVALTVASQESRFLNYANDGRGDDLAPEQAAVADSLDLPHQAVGTDHGSVGVFQQQWPWWGSMAELMEPATAARKFYERLEQTSGWTEMSIGEAGQAVQRSAYPDAYDDDVELATDLLDSASGFFASSAGGLGGDPATSATCAEGTYSGAVVHPITDRGSYADQASFGAAGAMWESTHTGTDFSAACGTRVRAATSGVVTIRTDQSWSGLWLVQVDSGKVQTWYAHMQRIDVSDGQRVRAGQAVGQVGAEGNASGCHLHFEVRPGGGDPVDPTRWLKRHVQSTAEAAASDVSAFGNSTDYMVGTFNVLGHSHTKPGGNKRGWAPSDVRMRGAVQLVDRYELDVVGLQEFQPPQKRVFQRLSGSRYRVHSPPGGPANSIAWRRSRFALVSTDHLPIPYFEGKIEQMPIVRLRDRMTEQDSIYINVHNPADTRLHPRQGRHRAVALRRERAVVRRLEERHGIPVFLIGDLNSRRSAFCELTRDRILTASSGGSRTGPCRPPKDAGIDWILGSRVAWAGHWPLKAGVQGSVTDHPLVLARVRLIGAVP